MRKDLNNAVFSQLKPLYIDGKEITSLMIIFKTVGCSYSRTKGGCTHCSLIDNSHEKITSDNLKTQFEGEIKKYNIEDYQHIELLTLGSFLDEEEIPFPAMKYILNYISNNTNTQRVLVESRPEFITKEKLYECITFLNQVKLEIGIGVESSNDYVREILLKKGYGMEDIKESLRKMAQLGVGFLGYVLHKPVGLENQEAIRDSIETIQTIFQLGQQYYLPTRVALQPYYIARDSYSYQEYLEGRYKVPTYWNVIEILKETNHLGDISVALSDEGLSEGLVTSNCSKCNSYVIKEIEKYNYTNNLTDLLKIECICKK